MGSYKDSSSWDLLDDFNPAGSTHARACFVFFNGFGGEGDSCSCKHDAGVGAT
jgi:hypothetical protein